MKEDIKAHDNVLGLIGNTPLIRLNKITESLPGNFYAKVEAFNLATLPKTESHFILLKKLKSREFFLLVILSLKLLREIPVLVWLW